MNTQNGARENADKIPIAYILAFFDNRIELIPVGNDFFSLFQVHDLSWLLRRVMFTGVASRSSLAQQGRARMRMLVLALGNYLQG